MSDEEDDNLARALALSIESAREVVRPRRVAAQQAQQRIQAPASTSPLASDDDGEEEEEEEDIGGEGGEGDGAEEERSAYEVQRLANIAANQEKLASLGLLLGHEVSPRPRAERQPRQRPAPVRSESSTRSLRMRIPPAIRDKRQVRTQAQPIAKKRTQPDSDDEYTEVVVGRTDPTAMDGADSGGSEDGGEPEVEIMDEAVRERLGKLFQTLRKGLLTGNT